MGDCTRFIPAAIRAPLFLSSVSFVQSVLCCNNRQLITPHSGCDVKDLVFVRRSTDWNLRFEAELLSSSAQAVVQQATKL